MQRRLFLKHLNAASALPLFPASAWAEKARQEARRRDAPAITDVTVWRLEGTREGIGGAWQGSVQPLHVYPEHRPEPYEPVENPEPYTTTYRANYLEIEAGDGLKGLYGPVDDEAAVVVDRQLRDFLIGQNPLAGERLWDQMYRLNRHARTGHFMMAISAADNALWDLRGRYFGVPVYELLGGPTREAVEVYGSTLGSSVQPEAMQARAVELKEEGFRHQKWFLAYGPGDGAEGMRKNVEMVRLLREAVGDGVELMFDAFMGWDLTYALRWAEQVEKYRPRWIEEAFSPDKLDSFVALSRATSIPVATGEHLYNRWEVQRFLEAGAIQVVQTDPEWCGGVSELVKICTLASAYDVPVIPHGHNLHAALHVVAAQSPMTCPLAEYLIGKMSYYYLFEEHQLTPVDGQIALPDRPGFGISYDEAKVQKIEPVTWR